MLKHRFRLSHHEGGAWMLLKALGASSWLLAALVATACAARPQVVILAQTGAVAVNVEIASTRSQRSVGLMFRDKLGANKGMLFLFPKEAEHKFWMKNTKLSLDMIFIGSEMSVVGIIEKARPFSTRSLTVGRRSRFVLEVEAGFAAASGIRAGDKVIFRGFDLGGVTVEAE